MRKSIFRKTVSKSGHGRGPRNSPSTTPLRLYPPKPSPRGEGAPVRTLGRMRGRFGTQPFLVEKRRSPDCRLNEVFLLPRWATRSPPHQSPSVTASPQGEASGLCSPTRKSVPNQGTYMGLVIAPLPQQCATTAKTSGVANERAIKGAGASPPRLFASGLSLEKAWIPARDRAGNHLAGANLRWSKPDHLPTAETARPALPGVAPHTPVRSKAGIYSAFAASTPWVKPSNPRLAI